MWTAGCVFPEGWFVQKLHCMGNVFVPKITSTFRDTCAQYSILGNYQQSRMLRVCLSVFIHKNTCMSALTVDSPVAVREAWAAVVRNRTVRQVAVAGVSWGACDHWRTILKHKDTNSTFRDLQKQQTIVSRAGARRVTTKKTELEMQEIFM